MIGSHRMLVASAGSHDEIMEIYDKLSEYKGYKGKMTILREFGHNDDKAGLYPFPDYDSNIDEEETHS